MTVRLVRIFTWSPHVRHSALTGAWSDAMSLMPVAAWRKRSRLIDGRGQRAGVAQPGFEAEAVARLGT
jgi:hypothetical protein